MSEKLPTPGEIRANLDQYVIGQDNAKKVISVAVYNHYKRIRFADEIRDIEIKKSNVMMIGPTGSGKTYIVQNLARMLGVPLAMADATVIVTAEDIGKEISNVLLLLLRNSEGDVKLAEQGMVFIDEIDKLVTGANRVKGEGIQQALLKVLEGTKAQLNYEGERVELDTTGILFVVGGAFVNLATIVQIRIGDTKAGLMEESELVSKTETEDLAKFGLIPEFVGRLPVIVQLLALDVDALAEALVKPKNNIVSQFQRLFELDGVELVFEEEAIKAVAQKAYNLKTGARGLRTVVENAMRETMYMAPNEKNLQKVTVTADVILNGAKPLMEYTQATDDTELEPLIPKTPRSIYAYGD